MVEVFINKLISYPLLHQEIIQDLVDERKTKAISEMDFIRMAIKEKLEKEYGSLEPKPKLKLEEWWDGYN